MEWFLLWVGGGIVLGVALVPLIYAAAAVEHVVKDD